jgi:Mlc titration factor MtfA (ptsG expression regulator)
MLGIFRAWKRRRLARRPFPGEWLPILEQHVPFYGQLSGDLRERFLELLKVFIWEKHFIPAGGMEITDEVRVVIAAAAVRLVLHLDLSEYDRLTEIVVYPSHYQHPGDEGVVLGEAHSWGTVVLSWDAVLHGLRNTRDGLDTATHEFAHVLDRAGGAFNGTPELRRLADYQPWAEVMSRHFLALQRGGGRRQVLRAYGATNEAEFFAVATEAFFERPDRIKKQAPDLYAELSRFYGFDPCQEQQEQGNETFS